MNNLRDKILHRYFPTINDIKTEIINLSAILNLPKSTEEFVSDIHGEFDAFNHIFRNGSGNIKQKIHNRFHDELTIEQQKELAFLIYYPTEIIEQHKQRVPEAELSQWYEKNFYLLIELLKQVGSKYTRSKVRRSLAKDFVYLTEEMLYTNENDANKRQYYQELVQNLISLGIADQFIIETAHSIQQLVVDRLHVIGDIYDRGPHPDKIIELLMTLNHVDVQWGNHDILWLGGASGSALCICNLIRISARYNNLDILEDNYGINLRHLSTFAEDHYELQPAFAPKVAKTDHSSQQELDQANKIQQAIAIIQFKLEGHVIKRRPEFNMDDRLLLDKISADRQSITIDGTTYPLESPCFQTVDASDPYALTQDEEEVVNGLISSFVNSTKLKRHLDFLMDKGSMYLSYNDNLLIHGCVPVNSDGSFAALKVNGQEYAGKQMFEFFEQNLRTSYRNPHQTEDLATDLVWYLWTGSLSPLFGKQAMKTFERYFIADKATHEEVKNPYYDLRHEESFVVNLLQEFDMDPERSHVINGHTPVKKGHSPVMANGKMFVIDGGMSKAYQKTTGIGGYTLLSNSHELQLISHEPFTTKEDAIEHMTDIVSTNQVVENFNKRMKVADTTIGHQLQTEIEELKELLKEY